MHVPLSSSQKEEGQGPQETSSLELTWQFLLMSHPPLLIVHGFTVYY